MAELKENVIEWFLGDKMMSVTTYQKKLITRINKLAKNPEAGVTVEARNSDGSIFAHVPLKALHLTIYGLSGNAEDEEEEGEEVEG
jgi:hypothetical protein